KSRVSLRRRGPISRRFKIAPAEDGLPPPREHTAYSVKEAHAPGQSLILDRQYLDPQRLRVGPAFHRDIGNDMPGQRPFGRPELVLQRAPRRGRIARRQRAGKDVTRADEARARPGPEGRGAGREAMRQFARQQAAQPPMRTAGTGRQGGGPAHHASLPASRRQKARVRRSPKGATWPTRWSARHWLMKCSTRPMIAR